MVVAVERGLDDIKKAISDAGYSVVDGASHKGAIDAYVYEKEGFSAVDDFNTFSQSALLNHGVLIVNVKNKTADEILDILRSRVYGNNINFL